MPRGADLPLGALALAWALLTLILLVHLGDFLMRRFAIVAALAAASVLLSGCLTAALVKDLPPEAKKELALKFLERCGGTVNISAGAASGQLGGAAHGDFQLTGTCPTPEPPRAAPAPAAPQ